jgi:hypothetical protein
MVAIRRYPFGSEVVCPDPACEPMECTGRRKGGKISLKAAIAAPINWPGPAGTVHQACACLRPKFEFAIDSLLEGNGFELLVPPRKNAPRARHVVSAQGCTSS